MNSGLPPEFFLLAKAVWVYDLLLRVSSGSQHNLIFRLLGASFMTAICLFNGET